MEESTEEVHGLRVGEPRGPLTMGRVAIGLYVRSEISWMRSARPPLASSRSRRSRILNRGRTTGGSNCWPDHPWRRPLGLYRRGCEPDENHGDERPLEHASQQPLRSDSHCDQPCEQEAERERPSPSGQGAVERPAGGRVSPSPVRQHPDGHGEQPGCRGEAMKEVGGCARRTAGRAGGEALDRRRDAEVELTRPNPTHRGSLGAAPP